MNTFILFYCFLPSHIYLINVELHFFLPSSADTIISTGCCATLDNIITRLFKKLIRKRTKPLANPLQNSEAFIMTREQQPEILQLVVIRICSQFSYSDMLESINVEK